MKTLPSHEFVVPDTEGTDDLKEVAVVNQQGELIYQAFVREHSDQLPLHSLVILNLFPDRWQQFQQVFSPAVSERISQTQLYLQLPSKSELQDILQLKLQLIGVDFDSFFTSTEREAILNQPSIRAVLNRAADYFRYKVHKIPLPNRNVEQANSGMVRSTTIKELNGQSSEQSVQQLVQQLVEQRLNRLEAGLDQIQQLLSGMAHLFQTVAASNYSTNSVNHALNVNIPVPKTYTPSNEAVAAQTEISDYLQTQRHLLTQDYARPKIITDSDDLGKLLTIAEGFKQLKPIEIDYLQFSKRKLPEHLVLQGRRSLAVGFVQIDGGAFTSRLKNWNELVINYKQIHFQLWRDLRLPDVKGKVAKAEIDKLNYADNGAFLGMEQEQRLDFELLYRLITDIQNRDLEVDLPAVLEFALTELQDSWLCQLLHTL